jgi:L-rhamnose mutarotase
VKIGHVWRIRDGYEDEYARRHATVWPALEQLFRDLGVREYVIYRWQNIVFSHMELDDYDRLVRAYAEDPVALAWEEEFGEMLEYPNAVAGWPEQLDLVWSLLGP